MADAVADTNINPSQVDGGAFVSGPIAGAPQPVAGSATPPVVEGEQPKVETPVAPEPKAETPKVEVVPHQPADDKGVVVYDETNDPGLNVALSFIGNLGIAGDHPAMVAAANGSFAMLEAELATKGDAAKGWEQIVALGKAAYEKQAAEVTAQQEATNKAVFAVAGGEANWKALVAWAGQKADPQEKAALNAMFDAGPIQARIAAESILRAYQGATGTTINPANPASNASGVAATAPVRMSAQDYHAEVTKLHSKLGNAIDTSPEYAALKQRYLGQK